MNDGRQEEESASWYVKETPVLIAQIEKESTANYILN